MKIIIAVSQSRSWTEPRIAKDRDSDGSEVTMSVSRFDDQGSGSPRVRQGTGSTRLVTAQAFKIQIVVLTMYFTACFSSRWNLFLVETLLKVVLGSTTLLI